MEPEHANAIRIGRVSAAASALLSLSYVIAQLFEWAGVLGSQGGPNSASTARGITLLLLPSLLLGSAYVVLIAALHQIAPRGRKVFSLAALAFATAYATLTGLVYFVQLTLVGPRLEQGDTSGIELLLFVPYKSFLFAIDLFGYSLMCASTLFAAFAIPDCKSARLSRIFLLLNGLLLPALAFQMFVPQLIWVGALWAITFPAATILVYRVFAEVKELFDFSEPAPGTPSSTPP